ncbi:TPA: antitoxin family protein [Methanocaldococcus jannaschii]|uniref:Putative antitoxin MJ0975 n=2 Tax=Methanocaldococcus jannaschii TaxID=2190 RepID=VAPB2_METJA|nr:antitoxin family protein [Methanocaldococcus jannaschii]Q58385.2 RecName: Full=Putative antitoxin MJ0975 [Methanocaldococcus jannaschii DSM 2661]HII59776.1 antitoxin family protein [Methanocaldococcus jannaschii]
MEIVVDAIYEKGVLKLKKSINLPEGCEVEIKIIPKKISEKTFGILKLSDKEIKEILEEIENGGE